MSRPREFTPNALWDRGRAALSAVWHQRQGPMTAELERVDSRLTGGQVPRRLAPDSIQGSVCGYYATGCQLDVHVQTNRAVNLTPSPRYPVNRGVACPKGWEALQALDSPHRATTPLLKESNGNHRAISWQQALSTFCDRFQSVQHEHGKHSIAFLSTGQLVTEEMALLGSLAKFGMGMRHGDGNTRQCMATAVSAYKEAFGFDAPPYTYQDFEESDCVILVGSNLCIAHPILWERICRNSRGAEIIVVDPRMTETAAVASTHLQITPKSDQWLFYAVASQLIKAGHVDSTFIRSHTQDFESFAQFVEPFTLERSAAATGLRPQQILDLVHALRPGRRVSLWWTMGVNQNYQGTRTAQSLINLALMTGNIGRPGTGANSITGQCNAMGSRLFSNTTNLLGGRDFSNRNDRDAVAKALNIDVSTIPTEGSWPYHRILAGIETGEIRALWIVCTNPAHSWIDQTEAKRLLGKLDFLVVQDMYHNTETAQLADLILPAAGWGEKEGTFINSERRIGLTQRVAQAPGEALSDFSIFRLIAEAWGCGPMFRHWTSPEAAFQILKSLSRGQPCDFSGIEDYAALLSSGGVQWPCAVPSHETQTERRLFEDGKFFHDNGRARFIWADPEPMPEPTDTEFPLLLLTGRGTVAQWHTQTRTSQSFVLRSLYPATLHAEIHPLDASCLHIVNGQRVRIESRRGSISATALLTSSIGRGQVFLPMHYATVNQLTLSHFDPYSHQPSYKNCAVRVISDDSEAQS